MDANTMLSLPKSLAAIALIVAAAAAPARAATLDPVDLTDATLFIQDDGAGLPEQPKLFSVHAARDQNVNNNGRVGDDLFIRDAGGTSLTSANILWAASGAVYNWTLSRSDTTVTFTVNGNTITSTVASGNWNIVSFFLRANDTTRFTSSTVTVNTTSANGQSLTVPLSLSVTNSTFQSLTYAFNGLQTIRTLSGTLKFDYALKANAKQTPGDALSFDISGSEVTAVPLPASGMLLLGAFVGLGVIRRKFVL